MILLMFDSVKDCIFARHVKDIWVSFYMRNAYGRMKKMRDMAGYAFFGSEEESRFRTYFKLMLHAYSVRVLKLRCKVRKTSSENTRRTAIL